jgi:hypothetical protein
MEENIEHLVRRISSSSMRTIVRHTWEFCKDYKEAGNFQTGVLVSPRDLELLDLNISPLEIENVQH